ncbi:MAG: hypothetical protein QHH75_03770 [Bacillota bacterium]|nr:hypothetical protein [Bacillota bacterium]
MNLVLKLLKPTDIYSILSIVILSIIFYIWNIKSLDLINDIFTIKDILTQQHPEILGQFLWSLIILAVLENFLIRDNSKFLPNLAGKTLLGALSPLIANFVILELMESFQLGGTKGLLTISFLTFAGIMILAITPVPFLSDIAIRVFKYIFLTAVLLAFFSSLTTGVMLEILLGIVISIIIIVGIYFLLRSF